MNHATFMCFVLVTIVGTMHAFAKVAGESSDQGVSASIGLVKETAQLGDKIPAELIVKNDTAAPIKVLFNENIAAGVEIEATGKGAATREQPFYASIEEVPYTIAPGKSRSFRLDISRFVEFQAVGRHVLRYRVSLQWYPADQDGKTWNTAKSAGELELRVEE